jgi:hypothetical protein
MYKNCIEKLASIESNTETGVLARVDSDKRAVAQLAGIFEFDRLLGAAAKGAAMAIEEGGGSKRTGYEFVNLGKIFVRLLLFILLTAGYCFGFASFADGFLSHTSSYAPFIMWSHEVHHHVQETHFRIQTLFYNTSISLYEDSFSTRQKHLDQTLSTLQDYRLGLLNGHEDLGTKSLLHSIKTSHFAGLPVADDTLNILLSSDHVRYAVHQECHSIRNGVITHGLLNALHEYDRLANDIVGAVESFLPRDKAVQQFPTYPPLEALDRMAYKCFPILFQQYVDVFFLPAQTLAGVVNGYVNIIATTILIVALVFLYWVVFKPLLISIEREVALTPSMLLMLPVEVRDLLH